MTISSDRDRASDGRKSSIITMTPIATPIGSTRTAPRSETSRAASTAPIAIADRDHALQHRRLRQVEAQRARRPVDDDELQRRARRPRTASSSRARSARAGRVHRERDAVRELANEVERIHARRCGGRRRCRGMNQLKIAATTIDAHDHGDRRRRRQYRSACRSAESRSSAASPTTFGLISTPPSSAPRMIEVDRRALDPAVGDRRADRGGRSSVRMPYFAGEYAAAPKPTIAYAASGCIAEQHHRAADDLHGVGEQHHAALRHRIGERADRAARARRRRRRRIA